MTTRRDLVAFVAANLVAFAVALVAVNQPWIADLDDVPRALIGRWLPYALALCAVPTLLLRARLDDHSDALRLRAIKPDIEIGITVGAGHFHQLEVPEQVNSMIERFLSVAVG